MFHLIQQAMPTLQRVRALFKKSDDYAPKAAMLITFIAWTWAVDWAEDWMRSGKILFGLAGVSLMAAVYICKHFHWTVALFYIYCMGQWIALRMAPVSIEEIAMLNAVIFAAIFTCKNDGIKLLKNWLVIDSLLQSVLGLIEVAGYFPFHPITFHGVWPPIAAAGHPTLLGPYLAVCIPFLLQSDMVKNPKWAIRFKVAGLILIGTTIGFCQSTMTMATLGTVCLVSLAFAYGIRALAAAGCLAAISAIVVTTIKPSVANPTGRIVHWKFAWDHLTEWGYGAGTWMPVNAQRHRAAWEVYQKALASGFVNGNVPVPENIFWGQLHMDPLQGLFEWGAGVAPLAIGFVILLWITAKAIRYRRKELMPWAAMFFGITVDSCGNFPLHTLPLGALWAIGACVLFRYDFEKETVKLHMDLEGSEGIHLP